MRVVVRPNFDTLYTAFLDLASEPMIISALDTSGRYYFLPMLYMWTDVFASPGWRTTGTQAGNFLVTPPSWSGTVPSGMIMAISATGLSDTMKIADHRGARGGRVAFRFSFRHCSSAHVALDVYSRSFSWTKKLIRSCRRAAGYQILRVAGSVSRLALCSPRLRTRSVSARSATTCGRRPTDVL